MADYLNREQTLGYMPSKFKDGALEYYAEDYLYYYMGHIWNHNKRKTYKECNYNRLTVACCFAQDEDLETLIPALKEIPENTNFKRLTESDARLKFGLKPSVHK